MMDKVGNKEARSEIAMIKGNFYLFLNLVVVPKMTQKVVDRAIQVFGASGKIKILF
jgi:hypothetical protein